MPRGMKSLKIMASRRAAKGFSSFPATAAALKIQTRQISNPAPGFEAEPIKPKMWTGKSAIDPSLFTIDVTHENLMGGPSGNPALAQKMAETYEEIGVVLLRGQENIANHLDIMRDWAMTLVGDVSKYEGGANSRKGKAVPSVYEVGAPTVRYPLSNSHK